MSLAPGSSLGPYEVLSYLGGGGMGEVYRARDNRLQRIVAIKVLLPELSENAELRQRLEREARTISSLSHPNICTLFDVGETPDGSTFLVMEHLEGESLSDRLARGPLPLRQALRFGAEIADALDRAHKQGIVHRDLKPGNVMITKTGVKLLDFGLAKLLESGAVTVSDPNAATLQHRSDLTADGTIVGTLQYMAPEQLEGKSTDGRTDIFALGATLYEMLTGRRAFQADSRAGLIARIINDDPPPIASIAPSVPAPVVRLVEHCLAKDPDERWQTARDVAIQLRSFGDASTSGEAAAAPKASRRGAIAALLLVVAGAIAAALLWQRFRRAPQTPDPFTHLSIALAPDDDRLALAHEGVLAVSGDGSKIVFLATDGKTPQLYLRRGGAFGVVPLPGTENSTSAFFSPDGNEIAYASGGKLRRLRLDGGTSDVIADSGPSQGGSWGSDGVIVFSPIPGSGVMQVAASGGKPSAITPPGSTLDLADYVPEQKLLFGVHEVQGKGYDDAEVVAVALDTRKVTVLAHGTQPRYVRGTGDLLFVRNDKVWKAAFDRGAMALRGTPAPLIEPVLAYGSSGSALYDVTDAGDVVYAPFLESRLHMRLMLVARDGTAKPLPFAPGMYQSPHLADDGRLLSLEILGANNDVWLGDMQRGTLNRLTNSLENLAPVLSPDGRQVIVSRFRTAIPVLHLLRTDGGGEPRPIAAAEKARFAFSWSRDASLAAFVQYDFDNLDVCLLRIATGEVVPLVHSRFRETAPALSPDGKWIAYVSNETGQDEVYVRSTSGEGARVRVSADGGSEPLWSHSGREVFFRHGDTFLSAAMTLAPLDAAAPVRLFDFPAGMREINRGYDVAPDDQHFVMIERSAAAASMRTLNVVKAR